MWILHTLVLLAINFLVMDSLSIFPKQGHSININIPEKVTLALIGREIIGHR